MQDPTFRMSKKYQSSRGSRNQRYPHTPIKKRHSGKAPRSKKFLEPLLTTDPTLLFLAFALFVNPSPGSHLGSAQRRAAHAHALSDLPSLRKSCSSGQKPVGHLWQEQACGLENGGRDCKTQMQIFPDTTARLRHDGDQLWL